MLGGELLLVGVLHEDRCAEGPLADLLDLLLSEMRAISLQY